MEKSDSSNSVSSSSSSMTSPVKKSDNSTVPHVTDDIGMECSSEFGYDPASNDFATSTSSYCLKLSEKINHHDRNESTTSAENISAPPTNSDAKDDFGTKESNVIGNDPASNDLTTSTFKSCSNTSTDNQSTDSNNDNIVMDCEETTTKTANDTAKNRNSNEFKSTEKMNDFTRTGADPQDDFGKKGSIEIGNDLAINDSATSTSRSCSNTSTDNHATDSTKNDIDMESKNMRDYVHMECIDSNINDPASKEYAIQPTDNTFLTSEATNDPAINRNLYATAEDSPIIPTKTIKATQNMNDFIQCSQILGDMDYGMNLENNSTTHQFEASGFTHDTDDTNLDAGNSTSTKSEDATGKTMTLDNTINNSLFSQNSSTTNPFESSGSTHGRDDTNADARNSTPTKPADASGNTLSSDKTINDCPFSSFELDLYTLFLFVKDMVVNGSKTILVSPHSNYRRVVLRKIINRIDKIRNDDSLLNINLITCSLYCSKENKKGLPLQSLYDIMDDEVNTYIYTVQSESAHKVKFSDFGMNNIKDVKAFFSHLRQYKLYDLQGLQDFTNAMELGVSVDNTSDYLRVRKAFQEKFGIFMAFLDGNHRMTIAGLILGIIPITSDLNSDTYLDSYIDGIDIYKQKIQQTFTTWIQMDYNNSLLSADRMLKMSYQIKIM